MRKQIESPVQAFGRPTSTLPLLTASAAMLVIMFVGLIVAIVSGGWTFVAIFLVSIFILAAFTFINFRTARVITAATEEKRIDWATAHPELQRQNLNLEVIELSKILEVESGQISDLQSAYIVAEDLALRQIQQEENTPLMRHVTLGKAPFDAVMVKNDVVNCIEVAFLVVPDIRQERIDAVMRKVGLVKQAFGQMNMAMKVRLMFVLVTQLTAEDENQLRSKLNTQRFSDTPVDIDIRLLDFEALQRTFVTE